MGGGLSGSIFGAGGSKASAVEEGQVKTRFADVAGVDEAKEELVEVVDFLKSPTKYTDIGGKIPKGVLLVGPPGTGKTLLARAVAGEAEVSFFRISGSDFVEMFVGVGASRVRDLFKTARAKAPCIVFIDELDAIGKSRVNSINSNDEREQTLNQLLVEMDGFDNSTGLIVLAATNRPDVLDHALLRPGRFDRQVVVDRPDVKGREAILKIHAQNVKLKDVDLGAIARTSSGFSGADLANVINEAALLAVRNGRKDVAMVDLDEAVEKAVAGLQKKSRVIKEEERKIVAFHETGHALVATFTEGADRVHKISIIPRGIAALGYTLQMPEEDRYLRTADELTGEVDVLLGGRAAEQIAFGKISTGAANDIQRATDIVRRMITDYGMSEKFRNVALSKHGSGYTGGYQEPQLVREYSESTQTYIDEQIATTIEERYQQVLLLLASKRVLLDYIAKRLLEKETMEETEFKEIIKAESSLAQHGEDA
jgi:cell division protease FtsH